MKPRRWCSCGRVATVLRRYWLSKDKHGKPTSWRMVSYCNDHDPKRGVAGSRKEPRS